MKPPQRIVCLLLLVLAAGCSARSQWRLHNGTGQDLILIDPFVTRRIYEDATYALTLRSDEFSLLLGNASYHHSVRPVPDEYLERNWWWGGGSVAWFLVDATGRLWLAPPGGGAPPTEQPEGFPLEPRLGGGHLGPVDLEDEEPPPPPGDSSMNR